MIEAIAVAIIEVLLFLNIFSQKESFNSLYESMFFETLYKLYTFI